MLQLEMTRKNFESRVKEWEEKEQVLGHRIRSEINKPRELLSLPSMQELELEFEECKLLLLDDNNNHNNDNNTVTYMIMI
jgi:hypothetical protein